jgi:AmiR/NasT family two-component response regulator
MRRLRVLVAHELALYRETIAAYLRERLQHRFDVYAVAPEALDAEIPRRAPDVVICSTLTEAVETAVPNWIVLYPTHRRQVDIHVAGRRNTVARLPLAALVSLLERTCSGAASEHPTA